MDNVMPVWQVVGVGDILFTCARLDHAEYLRDWCEAEEYDCWVNSKERLSIIIGERRANEMSFYLHKFYIQKARLFCEQV